MGRPRYNKNKNNRGNKPNGDRNSRQNQHQKQTPTNTMVNLFLPRDAYPIPFKFDLHNTSLLGVDPGYAATIDSPLETEGIVTGGDVLHIEFQDTYGTKASIIDEATRNVIADVRLKTNIIPGYTYQDVTRFLINGICLFRFVQEACLNIKANLNVHTRWAHLPELIKYPSVLQYGATDEVAQNIQELRVAFDWLSKFFYDPDIVMHLLNTGGFLQLDTPGQMSRILVPHHKVGLYMNSSYEYVELSFDDDGDSIKDWIEDNLNVLYDGAKFPAIKADVERTYGKDSVDVTVLPQLNPLLPLEVGYSPIMAAIIKNSRGASDIVQATNGTISVSGSVVMQYPASSIPVFVVDDFNDETVLNAGLMSLWASDGTEHDPILSVVAIRRRYCVSVSDSTPEVNTLDAADITIAEDGANAVLGVSTIEAINALSHFKLAPILHFRDSTDSEYLAWGFGYYDSVLYTSYASLTNLFNSYIRNLFTLGDKVKSSDRTIKSQKVGQ